MSKDIKVTFSIINMDHFRVGRTTGSSSPSLPAVDTFVSFTIQMEGEKNPNLNQGSPTTRSGTNMGPWVILYILHSFLMMVVNVLLNLGLQYVVVNMYVNSMLIYLLQLYVCVLCLAKKLLRD